MSGQASGVWPQVKVWLNALELWFPLVYSPMAATLRFAHSSPLLWYCSLLTKERNEYDKAIYTKESWNDSWWHHFRWQWVEIFFLPKLYHIHNDTLAPKMVFLAWEYGLLSLLNLLGAQFSGEITRHWGKKDWPGPCPPAAGCLVWRNEAVSDIGGRSAQVVVAQNSSELMLPSELRAGHEGWFEGWRTQQQDQGKRPLCYCRVPASCNQTSVVLVGWGGNNSSQTVKYKCHILGKGRDLEI